MHAYSIRDFSCLCATAWRLTILLCLRALVFPCVSWILGLSRDVSLTREVRRVGTWISRFWSVQNVKKSDEKHSQQSGSLLIMRSEDMADIDKNPSRNCLSLSTGMKPSGGCFMAPVLKDRRNLLGRELWSAISSDRMIRRLPNCTECFSSLKHPPDGFIPVLRDRQVLDEFRSIESR